MRKSVLLATVLLSACSVLYRSDPGACMVEDQDGDGVLSRACGGHDCNDDDGTAYPGATESCNLEGDDGTDEDCDPGTHGNDLDGDGYYDERCFNLDESGGMRQGNDCDDGAASVHVNATEVCNGEDDDCDEETDETLPLLEFFPDCDGDGFGEDAAPARLDCGTPATAPECEVGEGVWLESGGDCDDNDAARWSACGSCAAVDLLIVMDTSDSMLMEQQALAMQLENIAHVLGSGDRDGDGVRDFQPIEDLQVGVITPDLGIGGAVMLPACDAQGDDAILLDRTGSTSADCIARNDALSAGFLTFMATEDRSVVQEFAANWSCLVEAGIGGCTFEQPLEAALKALTPARSALRFGPGMSLGHGDGANRGFLRQDSLLVVIVVTDDDDCSAADYSLFDPEAPYATRELNLRCAFEQQALHPLERYVSGLLELRRAEHIVYGIVAGIPPSVAPAGGRGADWSLILEHADMQYKLEPDDPTALVPACSGPLGQSARPARRLVGLARDLEERGARTVVSSICSPSAYATIAGAILTAAEQASAERCGE